MRILLSLLALALTLVPSLGCSSAQTVKQQKYAKLNASQKIERELNVVWYAVNRATEGMKSVEEENEDLNERYLLTDWVTDVSRDKYIEYKVNDVPKRKPLRVRYQHEISAKRAMGGTDLVVRTIEEIEELNTDGSRAGFVSVDEPDPARAREMLDRIKLSLLSQ